MFVENWMTPDPVTLPPSATISEAAIEMGRHRFRHIPVAAASASGKKLVGIVSKYDIARAFPNDLNPFSLAVTDYTVSKTVSTIMSCKVITVAPDGGIEEAARLLRAQRINALPVVRENRLVGIITESDIFDALLNMTGANSGRIKLVVECAKDSNPTLHLAQLGQRHKLEIQSLVSFVDQSSVKIRSILRFASRPPSSFVEDLHKLGFRVLTID